MLTLIRCKNVDYESSRSEVFLDIQLNIEGKRTLQDALQEHIKTETLDGDNKYDAGTYGLQVGCLCQIGRKNHIPPPPISWKLIIFLSETT
jgi:hypothetical protein